MICTVTRAKLSITGMLLDTAQDWQLGAVWRRFTGSDPGFGILPPFQAAVYLKDRASNGGSKLVPITPGKCASHTCETL